MSDPLKEIVERDPRYPIEAYLFVFEALPVAQKLAAKARHVTGRELLEGIRCCARDRYGLMAKHVLNSWGIRTTGDFGNIVFNLVGSGLLGKTEEDTIEEFHDVYSFDEAFLRGYHIGQKPAAIQPQNGLP